MTIPWEAICEALKDASTLPQCGFPAFDNYPNAEYVVRRIYDQLSRKTYDKDSYCISNKRTGVPASRRPVELCLVRGTNEQQILLLAVRAVKVGDNAKIKQWIADPSLVAAEACPPEVTNEWTFLRHECFDCSHRVPTLDEQRELDVMAGGVVDALHDKAGYHSIKELLAAALRAPGRQLAVEGFPQCMLDNDIASNLRPLPGRLEAMEFRLTCNHGSERGYAAHPHDILNLLGRVNTLYLSGAPRSGKTAAMYALLRALEEERRQSFMMVGLTCTMEVLVGEAGGDRTDNAPRTVASYVARRLVEALGKVPVDARGGHCQVRRLHIVLLIDEAGPYRAFGEQIGEASVALSHCILLDRNAPLATHLHCEMEEALPRALHANGWKPMPLKSDSLRFSVFVAGTGVGRELNTMTSLPVAVLTATFQRKPT